MYKPLRRMVRTSVKRLLKAVELDLVPLHNSPLATLAGLRDRPFRTVIDCGANQGQFARRILEFFPNATVYCFEPLDEPFSVLSDWAAAQAGRVRCFKMALGDHEGEVSMHFHTEHSTSSSLLPATEQLESTFPQTRKQTQIKVRQATLDQVLADALPEMESLILLKLDVQGYEDRVLRGATKFIEKVDACLLEVCVDPLYAAQAAFKDLVLLLDQQGLKYAGNVDQLYGEDGRVMWLDALFLRQR